MFTHYHQDYSGQSDNQQENQSVEESGTRTPTQRSNRSRTGSLYSSLQASQILSNTLYPGNNASNHASYSSPLSSSSAASPTTSSYSIDSFGSARNLLIENSIQSSYNANLARRISLPNVQRNNTIGLNSIQSSPHDQSLLFQQADISAEMSQDRSSHANLRGVDPSHGYQCPNCSKIFARDDLLRRHLTREARAQAQPVIDRQKSCHECARSKSRCDLEVPSCGRCRSRGKSCTYGARSGNPNFRKGIRDTQKSSGEGPSKWRESSSFGAPSHWSESSGYPRQNSGEERQSLEGSESDDSRQWPDPFQHYRIGRAASTSSASTNASYDPNHPQQPQPSFDSSFTQNYHSNNRSESPANFNSTMGGTQTGSSVLHLARNFSGSSSKGKIDTNVDSSRLMDDHDEEGEVTPITRTNAASLLAGGSTMGPPHVTPGRFRETPVPLDESYWGPSVEGLPSFKNSRTGETQRPQPPKLLTGAKMPQPTSRPGVEPISARPLFSAQLDLSGWLEEPVIPSPLYRMGPSLSAMAPSTPTRNSVLESPSAWTGGNSSAEALRTALAANHMPLPVIDTVMAHRNNKVIGTDTQVAARQWWAHSLDLPQNDSQSQGVAQACAGQFTIYPALMVLPEASSPVPPMFHRPWLANSRLHTPASLARARVLLAGYHVKLPSSEGMIWEMIANEVNTLAASFDQHINASDLDVFSSTAALWFLVILLLMSSDPSSENSVSEALVDSSLIGLSHFARLLSQRINACEERKRAQGHSSSFLEWGFEETMKRTLFASYALLVLQRFRETSTAVQSQLAGIDLILHVPLPATAIEFEAGNELEWRACQSVQITEPPVDGISHPITIYHLLNARKGEGDSSQQITKEINSYFDRHDDFTNVCLSVAFALDRNIS